MCPFQEETKLLVKKIETHEEFLLISHTNLITKIKNERLQPQEILEIFEDEFTIFWEKFGKSFNTELYTILDKKQSNFMYYLIEDTEPNRQQYHKMVDYFKKEINKLIDKISKRKFA